jgi:hypothetical protein
MNTLSIFTKVKIMLKFKSFLKLILLSFFTFSLTSFQTTHSLFYISKDLSSRIVLDSNRLKIKNDYIIKKSKNKSGLLIEKKYTSDNILISECKYIIDKKSNNEFETTEEKKLLSQAKYYYPKGKLKNIAKYDNKGMRDGEFVYYFENGKIKRQDIYKNDEFITGKCFNKSGHEIKYFPYEIEPSFDLNELSRVLIYPERLRILNIEEEVIIRLYIDSLGHPSEFYYDSKNSKEFIDEIIRILKNQLVNFTPAKEDGVPTGCWISIPFYFRLKD